MIAWQPHHGVPGPWHLTDSRDAVSSLCKTRVQGIERYIRRDPHKIDHHEGGRCPRCWAEWGMRIGASIAAQDQDMAERA